LVRDYFLEVAMSWQDIPGWTCKRIIELYDEVCAEKKTGVFVECGVAYGKSLAYLASIADPAVDILAVDVWHTFQGRNGLDPAKYRAMRLEFDSPLSAAQYNAQRAITLDNEVDERTERIEWVQAKSEDVPKYLDFEVDFVFLDDHHEYDSVRAEILAWLPKLKSGGIIAGHDVNDHYPGVERAVRTVLGTTFGQSSLEFRPPHPDENGWGGVWKWRKP
jgi:cephalosporin hydroxylase